MSATASHPRRDDDAAARRGRRAPRLIAVGLAGLFAVLGGAFIVGSVMDDPGGLVAIGLIALWLVPMAGLCALAWRAPALAARVLSCLAALVVAGAIWFALDPHAWRTFENGHGPVRTIGVFALMLPLALLGWRRPEIAGTLLLVVGVVPVVVAAVTERGGMPSTMAVAVPATLDGLLFLLAATRPAIPPSARGTP